MNKRIMRLVIYAFLSELLLLALTACDPIIPTVTRTSVQQAGWLARWLSHSACELPCWENITPGKTPKKAAIEQIEVTPDVRIRDDLSVVDEGGVFLIGKDSGTLFYKDEIVSEIIFNLSTSTHLEVQEILNAFGEPDEIQVYDCLGKVVSEECDVHLYYQKKGTIISLAVPDIGKGEYRVEIRPDSRVTFVYLLPSDVQVDTEQPRSRLYPEYLFPWKGYTKYP